jgi:hypothetical protein
MTTINRGLAEQIIANSQNANAVSNHATSYTTLDFNDNRDILLVNNYDSYMPCFLILNLFNWTQNHTLAENLSSIYRCLDKIHITFNIGYQQILQFPLQFLWNLKTPTIVNNKLYLSIPFDMCFGEIRMTSLVNNDIILSIKNAGDVNNYVRNFSLICKINLTNSFLTGQNPNPNQTNFIQQITSLQVKHYNPNVFNATNGSTEFQIRTSCFDGYTKGLFITCDIDELYEIKFYINNVLRINYDFFHIQNFCRIISCNMIYLPFNDTIVFDERNIDAFSGSINFSGINSSILNLKFLNEQSCVCVHALYSNYFRYQNGMGSLVEPFQPSYILTDTTIHPLSEIFPTLNLNVDRFMLDMSGNHIIEAPTRQGGILLNPLAVLNPLPPAIIYRPIIAIERSICNIMHENILASEHYMQCYSCKNNYSENAIKTWLQRQGTCPTCRIGWTNNNIYINSAAD